MKKLPKQEAQEKIKEFFSEIENKTPKKIKKIKRIAMRHNVQLGKLRKKFCRKCLSVFNSKNSEIRIKKGRKIIKCRKCGNVARWKII